MRRYVDCRGIAFAEHRNNLPRSVSLFPPPNRVKDADLLRDLHAEWWDRCQACGKRLGWDIARMELHHIIGGTKGRSDERTNLIMLCRGCHDSANSARLPTGRILYLKWSSDRENTDWCRLAVLACRFLPDLVTTST